MNEARVRLLFSDSLGRRERQAAISGVKAFERFGVVYDYADAGDRKALRHVRAGEKLGGIINAAEPVVRLEDFAHGSLWALISRKNIFGMGITPSRHIRLEHGQTKFYNSMSMGGVGGVLSTGAFSNYGKDGLFDMVIAAGVRYELGHVLGVEKHCKDAKCLMQEAGTYADFIERVVKPGLDFCRGCQARIRAAVGRAMRGN